TLSEKLGQVGFKIAKNEPCLFFRKIKNCITLVLVYVDDILVASNDMKEVDKLKRDLMESFELKELGLAKYCLGLEIVQYEEQIELSQSGYIAGLLKQYGMNDCNPVATPSELNVHFENVSEDESHEEYPYRELI
ncbi:GSCOCG00012560001-RA-CDS, partial [Cotesia congregata]